MAVEAVRAPRRAVSPVSADGCTSAGSATRSARTSVRSWLAAFALCLLAGVVNGQALDEVTPAAGTEGTRLTLVGSGFGSARGRVFLLHPDAKKDPPLAILSWSDDGIEARIRRAPPAGTTTLEVHTKAGDVIATPFTVLAPTISSLDKTVVTSGEKIVAVVDDMGTRRPRITLGFRRAKVIRRQKGEGDQRIITFRPPRRKVATGTWNLSIANRVGEAVLPTHVQITSSKARRIAPKTIFGTVDDAELKVPQGRVKTSASPGSWLVTGKGKRKDTGARFELEFVVPQPAIVPTVFSGAPADEASLTYREILDDVTTEWSSAGGALTLTVQGLVKRQLGGLVVGTLTSPGEPDVQLALEFIARRP